MLAIIASGRQFAPFAVGDTFDLRACADGGGERNPDFAGVAFAAADQPSVILIVELIVADAEKYKKPIKTVV